MRGFRSNNPVALAACAIAWGALAPAGGCTAPRRPLVVTDPDPSVKIPAYKKAVRTKDRAAAKQLVADLDSDDPAVRFYAIGALERMTGERFGYRYYDADQDRRTAVAKWNQWLDGKDEGTRHANGGEAPTAGE
jgi:hypothetical protein